MRLALHRASTSWRTCRGRHPDHPLATLAGLLVNVNTAVVWNICDQVVERYLPPHLPHYLPLNVVLLYVVLLPLAVLPINVLASDAFSSAGVWSSLRRLIDQSGGLWSMYTSSNILPALLGIAVRGLDQVCLQWLSLRINLARTAHPNALSGVIAWATSVLINAVSHPLWVMQNRLWLSPAALGPGIGSVVALRKQPYIGVLDCARSIIREEGWAALYRGFLETLILSVPGALFGAWQGRRIVARLEAESE